jgi:DNA sulfur modification protein DndD
MILTSLSLTDFGTFKGVQTFSLRPKSGRPIVLFGGKNGAGKSTILDAIRLCFYGQHALGHRVAKEQYLGYLKSRIHRNPNLIIQPSCSSISLEFDFADPDGLHKYKIVRSWEDHGTRVVEDLQLERDGRPLDEVSAEHWQEFIRDLVPIGASQLFFFDGEKIQQLAEDSSDQRTLADAVKLLLGVDVVERLDADLGTYLSRSLSQRRSRQPNQLAETESQLEQAKEALNTLLTKRDQQEKEIVIAKGSLDILEQKLSASGGAFAKNREALLKEQERVKTEAAGARNSLRELCSGLLPFSLAPDLCRALKKSLINEELLEQRRAATLFATRAASKIRKSLLDKKTSWLRSMKSDLRETVADHIAQLLHDMAGPTDEHPLHGYSSEERRDLLKWIDSATRDIPREVASVTKRLEQLNRTEHKIQAELKKAPADDVLSPLLQDLQNGYKSLAEINHNITSLDENIRTVETKIAELSRKCQEEAHRLAAIASEEGRLHLVPTIRIALEEFKSTLIDRKVRALEESVTDCFNVLCRKKDSMRRISIDSNSFSVTVKDKDGHPIPKGQLSAGEKQVYAISMLWALGKTSNRPLPLIIDTPLARLDRDHRTLLAEHYFPNASHQVLILSTDTEVDEAYFEQLAPAISKAYLLDFDSMERATTVAPGYFWRDKHEAVQAKAY